MSYKAVIFDMDGTIVNTDHLWKMANRKLVESKGVTWTPELAAELEHRLHGLGMRNCCQIIKDLINLDEELDVLVEQKLHIAAGLYQQDIHFIPGFPEFHTRLAVSGTKTGIATNADDATLERTERALQLNRFFGKHMYNISYVNNVCKPDPAIYLHAARQLGVEPHECIAIEDSHHGIVAAQKAGMICIGINSGGNRAAVRQADYIIDHYDELTLELLTQVHTRLPKALHESQQTLP